MWMAQQLSCPFLHTPKFPFPPSASCPSIWPSHVSFRPPNPQSTFSGFSGFKLALFILLSVNQSICISTTALEVLCHLYPRSELLRPKVWSTISPVRPCISPQDNQKSPPVFHRTLSHSRLLPGFLSLQFTIIQSRATGIADHILPLGNLLMSKMINWW